MTSFKRVVILIVLMMAGEAVFILPFVISRIFRPTFLAVFEITNLELGIAFSAYGWVAIFAYFFGGPIADRFSTRNLLFTSLFITGLSGLIMARIPSLTTLTLLYAFWGLSTILLFWAPCMKAIRSYGGKSTQGTSYGLVDGGRWLFAALLGSLAVILFDFLSGHNITDADQLEINNAFGQIILLFSALIILIAFLILFAIPKNITTAEQTQKISFQGVKEAMKRRTVWLQSLIILCAYVGYKSTDDFSLYVNESFGLDEIQSAYVGTVSFWVRPIAALLAGFLGDRLVHSKVTGYCFLIMSFGSLIIFSGYLQVGLFTLILINIACVSLGIYGLRGLYYALFQEDELPLAITGSVIGIVSVIGYTPDIFFGPLMGIILDSNPGAKGHELLFGLVAIFGGIGYLASMSYRKSLSMS